VKGRRADETTSSGHSEGVASGPTRPGLHVAAFDFDGTLTRGGSVWQFLIAMTGRRRVATAALAVSWKLAVAAILGGRAADEAKEALFRRTLAGIPVAELGPRAAQFGLEHYGRRERAGTRARLEWHRARGDALVLVSASPELYVRPVGERLGMDAVLATRLEVAADGRITGSYEGLNCRGKQKLERLTEWMRASKVGSRTGGADHDHDAPSSAPKPLLWAYGNSAGDFAMLAAADVGVDAGRLGRLGKLRRFRRLGDLPAD
jgi:phosphatidylglycerophosphatase C